MKKTTLFLLFGLVVLSGFTKTPVNYEQIAFDYFISKIFETDFKNVSTIEFKGKTETAYSTLGDYKFCLRPEEKLQALIESVTREPLNISKNVRYQEIKNLTISDFKEDSKTAKLYLYHTVRAVDNFYVFLSVQQFGKPISNYVVELNVDGEILRYCRMSKERN